MLLSTLQHFLAFVSDRHYDYYVLQCDGTLEQDVSIAGGGEQGLLCANMISSGHLSVAGTVE
jgi:ribulose 1,5-bisphosphate synthetase/thiazole synthase